MAETLNTQLETDLEEKVDVLEEDIIQDAFGDSAVMDAERIERIDILDEKEISKPTTKAKPAANRSASGYLTIVNTSKNGSRAALSKKLTEELGIEEDLSEINVGFTDEGVVLGQSQSFGESFNLKKQGAKHVVYSKGLVEEITAKFGLDFSGSTTSLTFTDGKAYRLGDGSLVFEVKMV